LKCKEDSSKSIENYWDWSLWWNLILSRSHRRSK